MWPADTTTPAATSRSMIAGVVISGASVTSVRAPRSEVSSPSALGVELAQLRRVVHALARDAEKGTLDVDAEHARHAGVDGAAHRGDGPRHHVEVVADQGRQEAGGAKAAVRRTDGADRLNGRVIVEQHAAAAVDLHVDETGQQQAATEVVGRGRAQRAHRSPAALRQCVPARSARRYRVRILRAAAPGH